ncbi:hypothetical protein MINS_33600 [Mycolicibacterium insubricum]|uniref:Uncharacterized protein n=1 Tax=Mycolicibacterium insubricum TaxID=444597 RepID=A0A1X0DNZ9_9MYCO|nr:M4 family metallopeptidase [Mycolicibacterium insubricum]ORA74047.1 hypothetical protein BST26_00200 [Mycolicibacterium insubricum]BBZ67931.1 hypothetical protein MINS_33600 [Mycolicibacterium insubricum]
MSAGALAVGLGAAVTFGHGVAAATPDDSGTDHSSQTRHRDGDGARQARAPRSLGQVPKRAARTATAESAADATDTPRFTKRLQSTLERLNPGRLRIGALTENKAAAITAGPVDTGFTDPRDPGIQPVDARIADTDVPRTGSRSRFPARDTGLRTRILATRIEAANTAAPDDATRLASQLTGETPRALIQEAVEAAAGITPAVTAVVAPRLPAEPTVFAVSPPAAAPTAAPMTLARVVADVLSWTGLRSSATGVPTPGAPLSWVAQSLWLAVRETEYRLTGQSPAAQQTTSAVPTDRIAGPDPIALADVASRPDVNVTLRDDGSVHVIDGTFTDETVTSNEDAARVLNQLAPVLGASDGFASAGDITVSRAGQTYYRLSPTVNGVPVQGSQVILVTDRDGTVTGVFNYYDPRVADVDVTPNARMDQPFEVVEAVGRAMLSSPSGLALLPSLVLSPVDRQLVIYDLDPDAPPRLAWRVTVGPSDPLAQLGLTEAGPATSYYVYADGADAGTAIVDAAGAPITKVRTSGTDLHGVTQQFNVQRISLIIFNIDTLRDDDRNITTYEAPYLFGLIPGPPVMKSLLTGWNPTAVSAQSNMAEVYDFYLVTLDRTSYDNAGAPISVVIDYNPNGRLLGLFSPYQNAQWDPDQRELAFGDAGGYAGALDVAGHEYTHAVFTSVVNPASNTGQTGALNESYADITGSLIEAKVENKAKDDPTRWTIGEESTAPPVRDMRTSATYKEDADVHDNSLVFSNAAYLMMTDTRTKDISDDQWAAVYYASMQVLPQNATFADARAAVEFAARNEDFTDEQLAAVTKAFDTVGIPPGGSTRGTSIAA